MKTMETKICTKCGRELSVAMFSKKTKSNDGLQKYCKECLNEYNKKSYLKKKMQRNAIDTIETIKVGTGEATKIYAHQELSRFSPRQLMEELKARGFQWDYMLEPQRKIYYEKI